MANKTYTKAVRCWGCGHPIHNPHKGQMFHNKRCAHKSELVQAFYLGQPLAGKKGRRWAHA